MSLGQTLAPHLPLLRRYSRALAGDQHHGDAYVKATLQAIIAAPDQFPSDVDARLGLYRVFQVIWGSTHDDRQEADSFDAIPTPMTTRAACSPNSGCAAFRRCRARRCC